MRNQIFVCIFGVGTHFLVFMLIPCVKWAKLRFTNRKIVINNEEPQIQVIPSHIYSLALSWERRYSLMNKYMYQVQFLKKRNASVKKLRSPEFSFSDFLYSFLVFSYPLAMSKNYPQVIFVKIIEVVIFFTKFWLFSEKKQDFFYIWKNYDFIILTILNGHNIQGSEKIERVGVFLTYFFWHFEGPRSSFFICFSMMHN